MSMTITIRRPKPIRSVEFSINWPAQHDWHRRYFVFERATYALEEFVAVQNINKFNGLSQKYSTVQQTV